MIASEREQFLQRLALFRDLEASELRALAEVAQVVQFPASALIFREGEAGDCADRGERGRGEQDVVEPAGGAGRRGVGDRGAGGGRDRGGGPGAGAGTTYWYTATAPTDSADQTAAVSAPHFVLRFQNNAATNNGASAEYPENAYCTARSKML